MDRNTVALRSEKL